MTHTPTPWAIWDAYTERGGDEYPPAGKGDLRLINPDTRICMGVLFGGYDYNEEVRQLSGNASHIVKCVNAHDDLIAALKTWLEEYIALVNSGDAGFWDPEKELKVIKTRELLLQVQS